MNPEDKFFLIVMCVIFAIGFFGYQMGKQDVNSELERNFEKCELEKRKLEEQNMVIKSEFAGILIDNYGKPLVWDALGVTKYKKGLCMLQLLLNKEIPVINELLC